MVQVLRFLSEEPALLLFLLIGFGALIGHISIKKVSLGAAAVLFLAIGVSAIAASQGVILEIPALIGHIGLALFTFTVGVSSGATFFRTLKTSLGVMAGVIGALIAGGGLAFGLGPLFKLSGYESAGVFAGAVTNTPALAAAGNHAESTVGYSIAYLFGVIGMLIVQNLALRHTEEDANESVRLIRKDIRIDQIKTGTTVAALEKQYSNNIRLTRVRSEENGPIELAAQDVVLEVQDVITVVGTEEWVDQAIKDLGHHSSHRLQHDRSKLDSKRITISDESLAGKTIDELQLEERFDAAITRVRRGDTHMIAQPRIVLELGDSVLVVGPRAKMDDIRSYLGDSTRSLTAVNAAAIGIGLALGFALGSIPLPLPGGGTFVLGAALCSLIVGLVFGKVGHVGNFRLNLPFTVTAVISELGLLLFLAQAGTKAGSQVMTAFSSGSWAGMLILGAIVTLSVGFLIYFFQRKVFQMGGTQLAGLLAGSQTQPALLAYANDRTNYDFKVSLGYTTAYPVAMITKILVASVLGILAG